MIGEQIVVGLLTNCSERASSAKNLLFSHNIVQRIAEVEIAEHLDLLLSVFVHEPIELRRLLRRHEAVITGETLMWFIMDKVGRFQTDWCYDELDICCPLSQFDQFVDAFIGLVNGEVVDEWEEVEEELQVDRVASRATIGIVRKIRVEGFRHHFNLLCSSDNNALNPVFAQWNTALFNILTHDHLIIAYPTLTLSHKAQLSSKQFIQVDAETAERYRKNGFLIRQSIADFSDELCYRGGCGGHPACPRTPRYFGDELSLSFPLSPKSSSEHQVTRDDVWLWAGSGCSVECCRTKDKDIARVREILCAGE